MVASLNSEVKKLILRGKKLRLGTELNEKGLAYTTAGDNIFYINVKDNIKAGYNINTKTLYFLDKKYYVDLDDVPYEIERLSENPIKTSSGGEWQYYREKNRAIYHDFVSGLVLGLTSDDFYIYISVLGKENSTSSFLKRLYSIREILESIEKRWFENSKRKKFIELLKSNNIDYREVDGDLYFNNYSYSYNPETKIIYEFNKLQYKIPFKEFLLHRILRSWKQPYKNRLEKYVSY